MLIQGGLLVLEDGVCRGDIRLEGERIAALGGDLTPRPEEDVEDARGCWVVPGGVDAHTHFDMPAGAAHTADDFDTGTRAALMGGTTTAADFAECEGDAPLDTGFALWRRKADGRTWCDYALHMTVSHWEEGMAEQMADMAARGVSAFKVYTAYQDDIGVDDRALFQIFRAAAGLGATVYVHCENGPILETLQGELEPGNPANHAASRPNLVEAEAVAKVLYLAALTGARVYIVHLSTAQGLAAVKAARARGVRVTAETCPQYLLLDASWYAGDRLEAAKYILSPPLRGVEDIRALWEGLLRGDVQTVATDHCAFTLAQKGAHLEDYRKIPNGIPGVEHRLALMYHYGRQRGLELPQIAALTAGNPARALGLYPRKGCLRVGSDGDLAVLDPGGERTITAAAQAQAVDYTPYEGMTVDVSVRSVYLRGTRLVRNGAWCGERPGGRFLACETKKEGLLPWELS